MPESVQVALTAARERIDEAKSALEADDPRTAMTVAASAAESLEREVRGAAMRWSDEVRGHLRALTDLDPPRGSPVFDLELAAERAATTVAQIPVQEPTSTADALLSSLHPARWQIHDLPNQTSRLLGTAAEVEMELGTADITDREAVQAFKKAHEHLRRQLSEHRGQPEAALAAIAKGIPDLLDAMKAAITRQLDGQRDMRAPDVNGLIAAGLYADAAKALSPVLAVEEGQIPREALLTLLPMLRARSVLADTEVASATLQPEMVPPLPPPSEASVLMLRRSAPASAMQLERAQAFSVILWSTWVQTALVFALLLVAGYVLFADEFVGSLKDVVQVFLWAFAIDVTVGALLQVTQGLAAPAPRDQVKPGG